MRATAGRGAAPHFVAAQIAWREDQVRDGTRHALDAADIASNESDDVCTVADVVLEVGETVAARACLDRVPLDACEAPLLLMRLAVLRKKLGQHVEALTLLDRAQTLGHASAALRFQRGEALMFNGRIEEAEAELAASLAAAPTRGRVAVPLVRLRRQTADRNYLAALEAGTRAAAPATHDQAAFEFVRYKTLEDLGRTTKPGRRWCAATRWCMRDCMMKSRATMPGSSVTCRRGRRRCRARRPAHPLDRYRSSSSAWRVPARPCSNACSAIIRRSPSRAS